MRLTSLKTGLGALVLATALAGCVVTARPAAVVVPGEMVAYSAPPAVRVETIGVAPGPGYFWAGGGWFWEGGAYAWHPGHWMAPRPGYHWVPHAWRPVGGTWHGVPGHWARN